MVWPLGSEPSGTITYAPQEAKQVDVVPYLAAASAIAALALAFFYYKKVEEAPPGDERMIFLMGEIQTGARAFLKKEYQWVAVFAVATSTHGGCA